MAPSGFAGKPGRMVSHFECESTQALRAYGPLGPLYQAAGRPFDVGEHVDVDRDRLVAILREWCADGERAEAEHLERAAECSAQGRFVMCGQHQELAKVHAGRRAELQGALDRLGVTD